MLGIAKQFFPNFCNVSCLALC